MDFGLSISEHISISVVASSHVAEAYEETRTMPSVQKAVTWVQCLLNTTYSANVIPSTNMPVTNYHISQNLLLKRFLQNYNCVQIWETKSPESRI